MNHSPSKLFFQSAKQLWRNKTASQQRGAVAVFVALSMSVMIGFAGLAMDAGRLYVHKSELQNAADACSLAAAKELICDTSVAGTCSKTFVQNAEIAGRFIAKKNSNNFQGTAVDIPANGALDNSVRFSTTLSGTYSAVSASDYTNLTFPKYARCSAKATGITPWFMGILGVGNQIMTATSVGTLAPSQGFCNGPPIGVCSSGPAPNFGYTTGQWLQSAFSNGNASDGLTGTFKWIDFTPSAGGTNELREQLTGNSATCNVKVGDNVSQPGGHQGAKFAYNTRFGIYKQSGANAYSFQDAPPDHTGYGYPNNTPGSPVIDQTALPGTGPGAYSNYKIRQGAHTPFTPAEYPGGNSVVQGNVNASSILEHTQNGAERRLVAVPVISCGTGNTPIVGMACILMLNPMSNGSGTIYLEYRGNAAIAGSSPCTSIGLASNGNGKGPLVPTLVQ